MNPYIDPAEPFRFETQRSLKDHLAFLQLDRNAQERLRDILRIVDPFGKEIVARFYEHLIQFPQTAQHLRQQDVVERLKIAQLKHLESMLSANWNEEYLAGRLRVGDIHAQLGIDPHSFLGAYKLYLRDVFEILADRAGLDDHPFVRDIDTLIGAVLLDVGLTLETYFSQGAKTLRKALEMLWQANAELRLFAQLTSHDLKTPLATVANLCDEVLDEFGESLPAGAVELITAARMRTFRMSDTIDELLETSMSLQAGDDHAPVHLERSFQEALDRVRPVIEAKRIHLELVPLNVVVYGNHVKLREALYNVLSNAAKFVEAGGSGTISIKVEVRDDTCHLSIIDNGPGIPENELERIFVPFRRLPMHRAEPGSGLGLYFTKFLLEQLNGSVKAVSTPGRGTTICIQLSTYENDVTTYPFS